MSVSWFFFFTFDKFFSPLSWGVCSVTYRKAHSKGFDLAISKILHALSNYILYMKYFGESNYWEHFHKKKMSAGKKHWNYCNTISLVECTLKIEGL